MGIQRQGLAIPIDLRTALLQAPTLQICLECVGSAVRSALGAATVHVGVDLLLADLFGDGLLVGHRLLVEADPLHRNGLLLDDRPLLVQYDLVLLFADIRAGRAAPTFRSVIGSRSTRTSSRLTGTVWVTFSVVTYFRSRARPASSLRVPTLTRSSDRVIASSVVGPEVS
jgi:hypothetical protein